MKIGPTGDYPEGKLNKDDEGGLVIGVVWDPEKQVVIINFGKPVSWLGMPREHAVELTRMILTALPERNK